jgi:hypothetical protein
MPNKAHYTSQFGVISVHIGKKISEARVLVQLAHQKRETHFSTDNWQ